jgi:hypothetical protein
MYKQVHGQYLRYTDLNPAKTEELKGSLRKSECPYPQTQRHFEYR